MIITQTPYRISLFGGGTDYPAWYEQHHGLVIGMAINRYCHIGLKQTPVGQGVKYRIVYSRIEDCETADQIQHPAVKGVLRYMNPGYPIEMHHMGDLPAMGGMGASSSFVVGMLHAINVMMGREPTELTLASMATYVEQSVIREPVGCQDQMFAALGGMHAVTFLSGGTTVVDDTIISQRFQDYLTSSFVLAHTGKARFAHEMAAKVILNIAHREQVLREMLDIAHDGWKAIAAEDLIEIATLLHMTWRLKKQLHSEVTNADIDQLYSRGRVAGAMGGKLLGAGGGGFMLFMVPPWNVEKFVQKIGVPCITGLKVSEFGSRVIHNQP